MPGAALIDALAALLNNGMAVYEMGGAATPHELAVIAWMAKTLGLPATAGGLLTSGGSLGNLTALLAARQARAGHDVWTDGSAAAPPLAVLVAATAHYSIDRAVRMLGWGAGGAIAVAVVRHGRQSSVWSLTSNSGGPSSRPGLARPSRCSILWIDMRSMPAARAAAEMLPSWWARSFEM